MRLDLQGYLAQDPTVGLCVRPYGGPMGWAFFYDRGTPVGFGFMFGGYTALAPCCDHPLLASEVAGIHFWRVKWWGLTDCVLECSPVETGINGHSVHHLLVIK